MQSLYRKGGSRAARVAWIGIVLATLLPAASASAIGLIPLEVQRFVFEQGRLTCDGCGLTGQDQLKTVTRVENCELELFDVTIEGIGSHAMQTSFFSDKELKGIGEIWVGSTDNNSAHSEFVASFKVTKTGDYALLGEFMGKLATNEISLRSRDGFVFQKKAAGGSERFVERFRLKAGEVYTLEAKAWDQDFTGVPRGGGWSFSLVPEPDSGLMVGLGLIGLSARRRRRRRR